MTNFRFNQKSLNEFNEKITAKGEQVGLSFYAFFENKNNNPDLLMETATWWIKEHRLDHFEKVVKIRDLVNGITTK